MLNEAYPQIVELIRRSRQATTLADHVGLQRDLARIGWETRRFHETIRDAKQRLLDEQKEARSAHAKRSPSDGLRGWTITSALRPLSLMLGQAARKGRIPTNPVTQLERGERPRYDDQRAKRILSLEEMRALIAAADSEQYRCLLELLLTTGVRIGEALGLAVADLDPKHNLIRIECQLDRDGNRTPLKTEESQRALDIPSGLMRRVLALVDSRGQLFNPQALVFASRNETGLERKVAREALKRAAKAADLAAPEPTLHDLRHSHASMLIALDYSVVDVQHRLGHRKPDTTLRIYTHQWKYRDAQRSRIGQQIDQLFNDGRELPAPPTATHARLALPPAPDDRTTADGFATRQR